MGGSYLKKLRGASRKSGNKPKKAPQRGEKVKIAKFKLKSEGYMITTSTRARRRSGISRRKAFLGVLLPFPSPVPASQ